jgi:hypothetical protein
MLLHEYVNGYLMAPTIRSYSLGMAAGSTRFHSICDRITSSGFSCRFLLIYMPPVLGIRFL